MRRVTTWRAPFVAASLSALVVLSACAGEAEPAPVMTTPSAVDLPPGVRLTPTGEVLDVGDAGTTVIDLGNGARSAVTVTVQRVREGDLDDFRFFTLDESGEASTPYYVDVVVRNEGPAGLGGSSVPMYADSDADVLHPPTELVGDFEPCPATSLPESFLAGASEQLCFVYLLPEGQTLRSVDLVPSDEKGTLTWAAGGGEDDPETSESPS